MKGVRRVDANRKRGSSRRTLSDVMEFDHVIWSLGDGLVIDAPTTRECWAPSLYNDILEGEGWTLLDGYSGQQGYSGPVMHASEYIGGRLAEDILERPGYYVAITADYSPDYDTDPEGETVIEGWAIAYKEAPGFPGALPCGCIPHETRTTGMGFTCDTEQQGYCNFECPHEEEA